MKNRSIQYKAKTKLFQEYSGQQRENTPKINLRTSCPAWLRAHHRVKGSSPGSNKGGAESVWTLEPSVPTFFSSGLYPPCLFLIFEAFPYHASL